MKLEVNSNMQEARSVKYSTKITPAKTIEEIN